MNKKMPKPKNRKLREEGQGRGYDFDKTKAELIKIATENPQAIYVADLYHAIGMDRNTFDKLFPKGSEQFNELQELLDMNVDRQKQTIRNRLLDLNQSAGLIALYKLIGTEDERVALSNIKVEKKEAEKQEDNNITLTIS